MKHLPGMMTDTLSLKFQIYDCFPLVFCFLLYFQDLCLHVLMLSYNVKEGHFCMSTEFCSTLILMTLPPPLTVNRKF